MSAERDQARTEEPTPRRRREARREGRVVQSGLLTAAAVLGAVALAADWLGEAVIGGTGRGLREVLAAAGDTSPEALGALALRAAALAAEPALGALVAVFAAALAASLVQVGPLFTWRPVRPDLGRLSPVEGWGRLWSPEARLARWRALLAALAVLIPAGVILSGSLRDLAALPYREPAAGLRAAGALGGRWLLASAAALAGLGLVDLTWQRRRLSASLRMTRREVERERREVEGDPRWRHERERRFWEAAHLGAARAVAEASVVVASSRVAVALYYDDATGEAPEVLARGSGRSATELRARARRLGVAVVEEPAVAGLLADLSVGERVPPSLYGAVAGVLRGLRARPEGSEGEG